MKINDPSVHSEVKAAFERYEQALVTNDIATLDLLFWNDPLTIRFGLAENSYGHDRIAAFRRRRPSVDLERTLINTVITTYGRNYGTADTEFRKNDGRMGRQSQSWVRFPEGWRIVSAHVSWYEPAA